MIRQGMPVLLRLGRPSHLLSELEEKLALNDAFLLRLHRYFGRLVLRHVGELGVQNLLE